MIFGLNADHRYPHHPYINPCIAIIADMQQDGCSEGQQYTLRSKEIAETPLARQLMVILISIIMIRDVDLDQYWGMVILFEGIDIL